MSGADLPIMKPSERLTECNHLVTQDLITRYAEVSGDFNPLHLDPEFAKTTVFGRTIAHGMMTLAFVSQAMSDLVGPAWESRGFLAVTFIAPVFAGDEVGVRIEIETSTDVEFTCTVECRVGDRLTLTGSAAIASEQNDG